MTSLLVIAFIALGVLGVALVVIEDRKQAPDRQVREQSEAATQAVDDVLAQAKEQMYRAKNRRMPDWMRW